MVKLNDIPFSDIYITPDKTAFIGDNRTENGLKIIEAEDFEAFYLLFQALFCVLLLQSLQS